MQVGSKGGKNHLKYIMHFRWLVKFQEYRQKCWCLLNLIGALPLPSLGSESGLLLLWLYDDFETRLEKASTICFSGIRKGLGWLWRICWESMSWSSVVRRGEKKRQVGRMMVSTAFTGTRKQCERGRGNVAFLQNWDIGWHTEWCGKGFRSNTVGFDHHSTSGLNLFRKKQSSC